MNSDMSEPLVERGGYPVLQILAAFPIACFVGALFTDIAYEQTTDLIWANFSDWLLAVGVIAGLLAAVVGLVSLLTRRRGRARRPVWPVALGSLLVLAIAFLNNLVHSRDGWTSVMPTGLALSAVTVLVMLATAWFAFAGYRRTAMTSYSGVRR